jgi:hypothetical protein
MKALLVTFVVLNAAFAIANIVCFVVFGTPVNLGVAAINIAGGGYSAYVLRTS